MRKKILASFLCLLMSFCIVVTTYASEPSSENVGEIEDTEDSSAILNILISEVDDLITKVDELEERIEELESKGTSGESIDSANVSDPTEELDEQEAYALECVDKLYNNLKNPSSLQVYSINYLDDWCMLDYSAENGFGGTNRDYYFFNDYKSYSYDDISDKLSSFSSDDQWTILLLTAGNGEIDTDKIMDAFYATH